MLWRKFAFPDGFSPVNVCFSEDAHSDLKKVLKACKALKPLQAAGLLSGYFSPFPGGFFPLTVFQPRRC